MRHKPSERTMFDIVLIYKNNGLGFYIVLQPEIYKTFNRKKLHERKFKVFTKSTDCFLVNVLSDLNSLFSANIDLRLGSANQIWASLEQDIWLATTMTTTSGQNVRQLNCWNLILVVYCSQLAFPGYFINFNWPPSLVYCIVLHDLDLHTSVNHSRH